MIIGPGDDLSHRWTMKTGSKIWTDSTETRMHALASVPYLAGLSPEDIGAMARTAQVRHLQKGEILFQEDTPRGGLHVVAAGRVEVFKLSSTGRGQVLHVERDGALGDRPLLDGDPYAGSGEA